jgi:hypothetical protein
MVVYFDGMTGAGVCCAGVFLAHVMIVVWSWWK